jgi:hypothetical protein
VKYVNEPVSIYWDQKIKVLETQAPLTAETFVQSNVGPRGFCGGPDGTGMGFSLSTLVLPCQNHSIIA